VPSVVGDAGYSARMLTRAARSVLSNAASANRLSGGRRSVLKALVFNCRQRVLLSTQATSDPPQVGPPATSGDAQSKALLVHQTEVLPSEPLLHQLAQQQQQQSEQKQKQQHVDASACEQVPAAGSAQETLAPPLVAEGERVANKSAEHLQELHCMVEEPDAIVEELKSMPGEPDARVKELQRRVEEPDARVEELQRRLEELDARVEGVPALIEKAVTPVQEGLKGFVEAQISEALVPIRKEQIPRSQIERMSEDALEGVAETQESIKEIQEMLDTRILATELKIQETMETLQTAVQDKFGAEQVRAAIAPLEKMLQEKVTADQANEVVTKAVAPLRTDLRSLSSQPTMEQVVAKALEARFPEVVEAAEQLVQAEVALVQDQIALQGEKLQSLLEKSHDNPVEVPTAKSIILALDIAVQMLVGGVVFLTVVGLLCEPTLRPNFPQDKALGK